MTNYSQLVRGGEATLICRVIIPSDGVTIDRYKSSEGVFFAVRKYDTTNGKFFADNSVEVNFRNFISEEYVDNQWWKVGVAYFKLTRKSLNYKTDFLVQVKGASVKEFMEKGILG